MHSFLYYTIHILLYTYIHPCYILAAEPLFNSVFARVIFKQKMTKLSFLSILPLLLGQYMSVYMLYISVFSLYPYMIHMFYIFLLSILIRHVICYFNICIRISYICICNICISIIILCCILLILFSFPLNFPLFPP